MAQAAPTARRDLRDSGWFRAAVVLAILVGLAFVATRVLRHDVVAGWAVLATCPAAGDAAPPAVSTAIDTTACRSAPAETVDGRGWPVLAVVLPASAGSEPSITRVLSDRRARTVSVQYDARGVPASGDVVVFLEVPRSSLPEVPFTVADAHGPVTVTSVPAA